MTWSATSSHGPAASRRRSVETEDEKIGWIIVVATVPAAIIGAAFQSVIEDRLGKPWQIAILIAVFALVLYWADRRPERKQLGDAQPSPGTAVGLAQSLALAPGVSRSGITISAGRFLGLTRDAAARLSFLLLVPIVLGAVLLKGYSDVIKGELPSGWVGPFVVGTIASAGAGLLAINWLLGYVRGHNYTVFVDLPACPCGLHPAAHRVGRARGGVLIRAVGDLGEWRQSRFLVNLT